MKYTPHSYQAYAIEFIKTHLIALLFLDMGLGKTSICLMAIKELMYREFSITKVLVVAPLRVARDTWPAEVRKWEEVSGLRVSVLIGTSKEREAALQRNADIYTINRENLKWLVDYLESHRKKWPFDMVILDELSSFKNAKSLRFKALRRVRPYIKRIVGLTGTPASNGLMDLWAEVAAVDGGKRLGRFIGNYRATYFTPDRMNPYTGIVYSYSLRPGAEEEIYDRISDITISMKAKDYLHMPEAVMVKHEVTMDKVEKSVYEKLREELVTTVKGEEITASNAAVLSGKLLQLASGAIYSDDGKIMNIHEKKLDMLSDLVEQANGKPVLVAYWFKHDHERIMKRLTDDGYHPRDLKTSKDIEDWNKGDIEVGLISPASAGHGLNLQEGGHILIWYSMIWSLEMYQQTNHRLDRQGQKEVVSIHHIITKGTVDEEVMKALDEKDLTQEKLIAAVKANITEGRE
ncbi:SNF2-related protein [Oribacterium sp. Sow4_G1_1]|uniref:SNF2-related protein n=1 Tax=Oribacterium sp. Sow4_G1_1 TaxID=3438794 RepID=UPI003F975CE3